MDAKIVFDDYTTGANNGQDDVTAKVMLLGSGGGGGATTLNQLNDVTLSSIQNKQVLKYNSSAGKWVNANEDLPNLDDLKNVNLSNPANGQVLKYNSSNNRWVNSDEESGVDDLNDLSDVTINSPTNKQVLKYNSTTGKWTNSNEESGVDDLNDLSDVNISSPSNNQVLKYDSTNSEWVNGSVPSGASNLDDLNDVDISTPTAGQVLIYDDTNDAWINGDAGNSSEQVISMADYLALTDAERNNGTSYYIYDAVNEGREIQPVIYSLEEREIGVWTDGKPLYQKTFISNYVTPSHTSGAKDVNIAIDVHECNIETLVKAFGVWERWAGDSAKLLIQYGGYESDGYERSRIRVDSENGYTNGRINLYMYTDGTDWQCVTIQYTKTTDTAGSGIWTTTGVPAVHYDGNEKIIGTWFGETLYEKTCITTSYWEILQANTWTPTGIIVSNANRIVDLKFINDSGAYIEMSGYIDNNYELNLLSSRASGYNAGVYITIQYTKSS